MSPLIWLSLTFMVFYVLVVRPQRRQIAAHQQLMGSLGEGDEVMTMGGIFGKILSVDDGVVQLEVAPGMSLRVARTAISRKVES